MMSSRSHVAVRRVFGRSFSKVATTSPKKNVLEQRTRLQAGNYRVTLLPGDGIGPEVTEATVGVFRAARVPIDWERIDTVVPALDDPQPLRHDILASIARNGLCLKGPLITPKYARWRSRNRQLRESLDIFANVVPIRRLPGVQTRHDDAKIDFVVIRENTEAEYAGLEHRVTSGVVQAFKVITRAASTRIAQYAFEFAVRNGRSRVTAIHKANIAKCSDGLFLEACRDVAKDYPGIEFEEMIVDNACMQLVMNPEQFDVVLCPNLYGNIIGNLGTGLVGGAGITPGMNIGHACATFEPGTRHLALDLVGKSIANPTGMILSGVLMLRQMDLHSYADSIEGAVERVFRARKTLTRDVGGTATLHEFTQAIIDELEHS